MGKFDGVLLVSDYDDTLYNHRLEVSQENRAAIEAFVAQGGTFTGATGRAKATFQPQIAREHLTLNAPVILSNGSAIYDFRADKLLYQSYLPMEAAQHITQVCQAFPDLAFESYHQGDVYVHNPNLVTMKHLERVKVPYTLCGSIAAMPLPWTKLILEQDHPVLTAIQHMFLDQWGHLYEAIFSNRYLLEITAKGNTKGALVKQLASQLGIAPDHIYCIGDNQNDLSMLALSAIPFAPANCAPEVRDWGARIINHCDDHAVAQVIEILDGIYSKQA